MGLRETKKERTRILISDIAVRLFIDKGYDAVTMTEIAKKAEVAATTLFNYFPTKESLVFDREEQFDAEMIAALRGRKDGQPVLEALHKYFLSSKLFNPPNKKDFADFIRLVKSSPELVNYFRGLWHRYAQNLAKELVHESRADKLQAECLSRLVFEGVSLACLSPHPKETLNRTFKILKNGWNK